MNVNFFLLIIKFISLKEKNIVGKKKDEKKRKKRKKNNQTFFNFTKNSHVEH